MIFTELNFLFFIVVLFSAYWLTPSVQWRKWLLLAASMFFYGYWDVRFLLLLAAVILSCHFAAGGLAASQSGPKRRGIMWAVLGFNLGLLGFFKYFNFFIDSFIDAFSGLGLTLHRPTLQVILPVGISFYIFQGIGYVIDVYRDRKDLNPSLLETALFVAFFPQLVAGPIMRASWFMPQLKIKHRLADIPFKGILVLFLVGFFKKAVIADNVALLVDPVFADPQLYQAQAVALAVLFYAVQIYCDFSGYTDMAIAVSRLFGYRLPPNFNAPYFSVNPVDFWRRWHISLSTWLRDYLYIPLGGNREGQAKTLRNIMLTMILGGLWHGASWNFVLWGFLHGLALVQYRILFGHGKSGAGGTWARLPAMVLTFAFVCMCWVPFRAQGLDSTVLVFQQLFGADAMSGLVINAKAWWSLFTGLGLLHALSYRYQLPDRVAGLPNALFFPMLGVWIALMLPFLRQHAEPFIYFQF